MSSNGKSQFSYGEDLTLAHRLADAADAITLKRYQAIDLAITTKPDNTPVTDADKSSEQAIRALLHAHRPEEAATRRRRPHRCAPGEWAEHGSKSFGHGVQRAGRPVDRSLCVWRGCAIARCRA